MEILHSEPINLELVADLCAIGIKRRPPTPRDFSAWHVTNLLKSAQLIVKGDVRYYEHDGQVSGLMSWGRIWESAIDCYLNQYVIDHNGVYLPDEEHIVRGGIICSLDGLMILPEYGLLVCETKLRFSMDEEIPRDHLQQIRAYCGAVDTDLALYVSGHIGSRPPEAKALLRIIRFTKQSVQECWQGILSTKEFLESKGCAPVGSTASTKPTKRKRK